MLCYIDDIFIYTSSFERHLELLNEVITRLRKAGLKLKLVKCLFARKSIKWLGYVITENGNK